MRRSARKKIKAREFLATGVAGLLALFGSGVAVARSAAEKPSRIVSLNLCTDQILLDLVPRERIAGLSFLATDPMMSPIPEQAAGIPAIRGTAEEVLALDPDLILVGQFSTPATVDLLQRMGRRVVKVPMASSFDGVRESVRIMADAAGVPARGVEMIAEFDRRLAAARAPAGSSQTAVALQVGSIVSGRGSIMDEVLSAAGYTNTATPEILGRGGRLALETLLTEPPDLIVLANTAADFRTVLADNLRHPAFRQLLAARPSLQLPMPLWLCGTPRIIEAVERLVAVEAPKVTHGDTNR